MTALLAPRPSDPHSAREVLKAIAGLTAHKVFYKANAHIKGTELSWRALSWWQATWGMMSGRTDYWEPRTNPLLCTSRGLAPGVAPKAQAFSSHLL